MTLPTPEPCRLGEIADTLGDAQIASAFVRLARPWEIGFLQDVAEVTSKTEGALEGSAYRMSYCGELGPLAVDYARFGGHLLTTDATAEFIRLRLVDFHWPKCDGSCGFDDDDDEWPSVPGDCDCADVEPRITLSTRGQLILAQKATTA